MSCVKADQNGMMTYALVMRIRRSLEQDVEFLRTFVVNELDVELAAHHELHDVLLSPLVVGLLG